VLRWALYEAAVSAARASSPDRSYYLQVAERLDHNRACLSVARKLCRRAYHILRELGEQALARSSSQEGKGRRSQLPPEHTTTRARLPVVTQMLCGRLPQTPRRQRPPAWTALRDRAAASNHLRGPHPIDHLVAGPSTSAHPGKAGRPARRDLAAPHRQEVRPIA
jgi:hypothetical protein